MSGLIYDLRHAIRGMRQHPGFSIVVILTLGLGIGANTAIFSIVNGVLLRPLAYRESGRLVSVREVIPSMAQMYPTLPVCARHFLEWRQRCHSFDQLSLVDPGLMALTGTGEPIQVEGARVTANLFETLGVTPQIGRPFAEGEDEENQNQVAILSHSLWSQRFNSDPAIVGKRIILESRALTVVGVMPATFRFPTATLLEVKLQAATRQPEVFVPMVFSQEDRNELMGRFNYAVIGRLKKGVSQNQALAELNSIATQLVKMSGETLELRANLIPLLDTVVSKSRLPIWILLGAVGAVLLIVCVNLANLMLARAEQREHESAIRRALGASPLRVLRKALTESLLLAILGGILGLALAAAGLSLLIRHAPQDLPRLDEVGLDFRVSFFCVSDKRRHWPALRDSPCLAGRPDRSASCLEERRPHCGGKSWRCSFPQDSDWSGNQLEHFAFNCRRTFGHELRSSDASGSRLQGPDRADGPACPSHGQIQRSGRAGSFFRTSCFTAEFDSGRPFGRNYEFLASAGGDVDRYGLCSWRPASGMAAPHR